MGWFFSSRCKDCGNKDCTCGATCPHCGASIHSCTCDVDDTSVHSSHDYCDDCNDYDD